MQLSFSIWLTTSCNLKCRYCYEGVEKNNLVLKEDYIDNIVNYILSRVESREKAEEKKIEKINIEFHGGEPLLNYKAMKAFVELANDILYEYEIVYQLTTNATILDDEIVGFLKENIKHLTVSFDGNQLSHDLNRIDANGRGTYDLVKLNGLRLLNVYGDTLRIRMTYDTTTVMNLSDNIIHLIEMGFSIIVAQPDIFDRNWSDEKVEILEHEILKLKRARFKKSVYINLLDKVLLKEKGECCIGKDGENIYPDGSIYACTMAAGNNEFKIGNIEDGVDKKKVDFIKEHSLKCMSSCTGCSFARYCDCERCRIVNRIVSGNYYSPVGIQCALNNIMIKCNGYRLHEK